MDSPRDSFSVAVEAIRLRMRSGSLVQGEQLIVSDLARELRLSQTPIREALARLAGEGLIADRRGAGHFAWRLDAVDLIELYDLQADYLRGALRRAHAVQGARQLDVGDAVTPDEDPVLRMEVALARIVQRGRSLVLMRAQSQLADRLAPARRVEPIVLPDEGEWEALEDALRSHGRDALSRWVDAYAGRRRAAATDLVAAMRSGAGG